MASAGRTSAPSSPLTVAQVSPYPLEDGHDVGLHAARLASELSRRGHAVLLLAPSRSAARVRDSRRLLRQVRERPEGLLAADTAGAPLTIAVGEVLNVRGTPSRIRPAAIPLDVSRTIEEILASVPLDFVHVHEPFAPSAASSALRHSRSLNVGSFHAPTERLISTQVARRFVQTFFGRLDARIASYRATAELMARHFPADYPVIMPGTDPVLEIEETQTDTAPAPAPVATPTPTPVRIVLIEREERSALRVLLRALTRLHPERPWQATVVTARGESASSPLRASLRERVRFVSPVDLPDSRALAEADLLVCASAGSSPAPDLLLRGLRAGLVPVASRVPVYEEVLGEGERGLIFEPGDTITLAAQLARLIADVGLRERLSRSARAYAHDVTWERAARETEAVYEALAARRHDTTGDPALRRRLASRPLIDVDLHMHTDHSSDCATPVEVLLATAREQGLGAIAVTDHNEISGALAARDRAEAAGVKVIVGEEVKTASQGEVIGLFIEHKIPRGLTMAETVAEIRAQGGLVYVPHPFDRMHSVPDYEHMRAILDDIDAIEVFNPRVAIGAFNEEATRFAAKYRVVAGAGSDSHVAQGLGSVRIRMRDFEGPAEFMQSLRDADIVRRPTSLLYVQALKFIQTKATPPAARRAQAARRVRRAQGGSGPATPRNS